MIKMLGYTAGLLVLASAMVGLVSGDCVQCSSAIDINCLMADSVLPLNCTPPGQRCFMRVVDGVTLRGCATDLLQDVVDSCLNETCQTCINIMGRPGCNDGVFPHSRRRCHVCSQSGNDTACAMDQQLKPQICELFEPNDRCFVLRRGTTFQRGCVSNERVCLDETNCHVCDGNGCNSMDVNTLNLPEAPGAGVMTKAATLLMVICLMISLN